MKTFFREIVLTIIFALVLFFLLQATVQSFIVVGVSMKPNFESGQRLLVNKATYYFHEPERGDVLIFKSPGSIRDDYIKRLIGLPGDTVEIKNKAVFVNGDKLDETYIRNPPNYTIKEQKIPEDSYFVLGDNRNNSNDSHNGWVVPRQNIIGKAWLSIWPPDKWGPVPDYSPSGQQANAMSE